MTEIDSTLTNQSQRRKKRLAQPSFDVDRLPNPVVEHTDNGYQPMRLRDARDVFLKVTKHEINSEKTSRLDRLRRRYGRVMAAERELIDEMDNPSIIFLSLRQSPIRTVDGDREWIRPVPLRRALNDPWNNMKRMLRRKLSGFPRYEYVRATRYSDTAATPHIHLLVFVEDTADELSSDVAESIVNCYVRGNEFASPENHTVNSEESDTSSIEHYIPKANNNRLDSHSHSHSNSTLLKYMMNHHPDWCLTRIWDPSSTVDTDSTQVDAATIAWSSPLDEFSSSNGFQTSDMQPTMP